MSTVIRRVVRVLIYEGPPDWVAATLKPIAIADGSIKYFLPNAMIRATRVEDVLITGDVTTDQLIHITNFEEPRT